MSALHVVHSIPPSTQLRQGRPPRKRIVGGFARDLPRDHRDQVIDLGASPQTLGPGPAVLRLIAGSQKAGYRLTWQPPKDEDEAGEMDPAMAAHLDSFAEQLAHHFHASPLLAALFEHARELGEMLEPLGPSDAELQARASQAQSEDNTWHRGRRLSAIQRATMRPSDRVGMGL